MSRFDVTTIGEAGLRLSVPEGRRMSLTDAFDAHVIGAELNVASTLSNLGWSSAWASAVHDSPLGDRVLRHLQLHGVDTSLVHLTARGRTGLYFVEYGSAPLPTSVHFDRLGTSFCGLDAGEIEWGSLLDTRIVHLTGLAAGLGDGPASIIGRARQEARDRSIPVSFDVNYRTLLWSVEAAREVLIPMALDTELLFCSANDAARIYGIDTPPERRIEALKEATRAESVFMSIGADGVLALADSGELTHASSRAEVVIDRLGAGDGMAAGVLHGWLSGRLDDAPAFGSVVAGLALGQRGESVVATAEELDRLSVSSTDLRR